MNGSDGPLAIMQPSAGKLCMNMQVDLPKNQLVEAMTSTETYGEWLLIDKPSAWSFESTRATFEEMSQDVLNSP